MDLEGARALAYEGSAWEMIEAAAVSEEMVRDYLLHYAKGKLGEGARRVLHVETLVPWRQFEVWALGLKSYPYNPLPSDFRGHYRIEAKGWLNALAKLPSDQGERDWRMLLSGLVWCRNLEDMQLVLEKIIKHCWHDHVLLRVSDTKFDISAGARCYFYMNDDWKCMSYISLLWGKEASHGPMGEQENDGPINRPSQLVAIARQLGIEPPARVIAGLGG